MDGIAVQTFKLIKTFEGNEVIKKCSITVKEGSVYGFLGVNGAGKTTVFKMLTGLIAPTAGKVEVLGMNIATHRNEILRNIGSIIELPYFYEHITAVENLKIHLAYMNIDIDDANISDTLEMVGLEYSNQQPVSKYSLGMRQRLGIARALVHNPKLLILDEPINGLDPMGIREMRELFIELTRHKKKTILISSHILSEIEHVADTVGVIVNGTVLEELSMSSIRDKYLNGLEDHFFNIMSGGNFSV